MAGFFGFFDYTKPGPGVPKDAPPKSRLRLFFDVLLRKFWKIIQLNLLYTIFNIPGLIFLFIGTQFMFPEIMFGDIEIDVYLRLMFGAFFICFPILCFGPAQAGMTFCLRNFAREEHAFLWSDFKEHGLKNLKESLLICMIDFGAFLLLCIAINFYGQLINQQRIWALFTFGVIALAFLLFAMMHLYIYPMLVTFHITVKQIYKNALIFATIRFIPNIGILLVCGLIIIATFIITELGVILLLLITTSLIGLIINFYSYPTIKKYMIDRLQEGDADEGDGEGVAAVAAAAAIEGEGSDAAPGGALPGGASAIDAGAAPINADGTAAAFTDAILDGGADDVEAAAVAGAPAVTAKPGQKVYVDGKFVDPIAESDS
ncbi:MAG: DUF624 domain-containing protein [Oscillospiraceae bacterium]|nr:DUF624 domain-containing protein [Oscillospiraceae bacterium]